VSCLSGLDAVILAGGQGSRLRQVCSDRPKIMALVCGEPLLTYLIGQLREAGIRRAVLSLGYLADVVQQYLAQHKWDEMEIVTVVEPSSLGTGGGLRFAAASLRSETVLVMNGDSLNKISLCELLAFHRRKAARASLLLTAVERADRYAVVETDGEDRITAYNNPSSSSATNGSAHISAGVYLMERALISLWPEKEAFSLERDVFPQMCGQGLYGLKRQFPFLDIGTPESYRSAEAFVQQYAWA